MANTSFNFDELFFETLAPENLPKSFDCGDPDLNDFLLHDALKHSLDGMAITTLVIHQDNVIGYFSLCSDAIRLARGERKRESKFFYRDYPAMKIARLAVCLEYEGKGIGTYLLDVILGLAQIVVREQNIAIKYLSVDAYYRSKAFYEAYGFVKNRAKDENPPEEGGIEPATLSMRFLVENRVEAIE